MDCPNCGLGAFVNSTERGFLCVLCLCRWPYPRRVMADPVFSDMTECCEPDYDCERGQSVHAPECERKHA